MMRFRFAFVWTDTVNYTSTAISTAVKLTWSPQQGFNCVADEPPVFYIFEKTVQRQLYPCVFLVNFEGVFVIKDEFE